MINKEIIIVASGAIEIPPTGYGAVEDLVWNYKIFLEKQGYIVKIVNTRNIISLINQTVFVKDKIIHFHYEPFFIISYILNKILFRNNKILWTSHNGYVTNNSETFLYKIISYVIGFLKSSIIISSSKLMEKYFLAKGFKGKSIILENGIDTSKFNKLKEGNKKILYLGNINNNKGQELFLNYYGLDYQVDFVGPYLDKNIDISKGNYLGVWTKEEIYKNISEYSVLVLLTKSEGDPLVVKEALSSGCSLLVSEVGGMNLDNNEFIKIIDIYNKEELLHIDKYLEYLINNNSKFREQIFKYSKKFDWENIIEKYKKILDII